MIRQSLPGANLLMVTGVLLVVFGAVALLSPVAAGSAVVKIVALILVVTGIVQLFHAYRSTARPDRLIWTALGAVIALLGILVWFNPGIGSGLLATLLMLFFAAQGFWKLAVAYRFRRFNGWLWMLLSGLLSLVFVYLLWSQWPLSGAWVIGVLVGLDLMLSGVAVMIVATAMRRVGSQDIF
ncbi:MAG: DUF308 domain-containing protein [Xanthomonadales bacterium]|nr:DUF308 domain-containing protein [Xanthomonadales bacterium]